MAARFTMAAALLAALALAVPAAAEAAGSSYELGGAYNLEGSNPDGTAYNGRVDLTQAGAGYRVVWDIAGRKFYGAGMLQGGTLSVGFTNSGQPGVVLMQRQSDGSWRGAWYYVGTSDALGQEVWTR